MLLPRRSILIGSAALPFAGVMPGAGLAQAGARVMHAIAMHGEPKYGPEFKHFDYSNPDAPKGGSIYLGVGPTAASRRKPAIVERTSRSRPTSR